MAAGLAAAIVYSALKVRDAEIARARADAQAESLEIVVAAHDLPLGSRVDQGSIELARWSHDALPAGAFREMAPLIGSFVRRTLVTNEPLGPDNLFQGQKTAGIMPLLIAPGMRAMSVQVDEISDIAGFVLPHTRVDVLVALGGAGAEAVLKNRPSKRRSPGGGAGN
jgi:pilus assembly protein CpaB